MCFWKIINPARKSANSPFIGKPMEGYIDGLPTAELQEICRYKNRTFSMGMDGRKYLCIY